LPDGPESIESASAGPHPVHPCRELRTVPDERPGCPPGAPHREAAREAGVLQATRVLRLADAVERLRPRHAADGHEAPGAAPPSAGGPGPAPLPHPRAGRGLSTVLRDRPPALPKPGPAPRDGDRPPKGRRGGRVAG